MTVASDAMKLKITGLDAGDFADLVREIGLTEKQAARAYRRAVDKTMTWLAKSARQDINRSTGIPMKALRARLLRYRTTPKLMRAKTWFGLKTLDATAIGKGRQLKGGVRVKQNYFFSGAFKGAVYGADEKIWIRKSSKHYDANMYPAERGKPDDSGFAADSGGRFPVVKARVDMAEAEDIFTLWIARSEAHLSSLLNRELALEVKRAGHA